MLSIARLTSGQCDYYTDLARSDYYTAGGEPPGLWFGEAINHLELGTPDENGRALVDREIFSKLFEGILRGKKLVQNAGDESRCPGWDLTFSAPKSVSTLWSQLEGSEAKAIQEVHQKAVERALSYLEDKCAWTRRGKGGAFLEKAKLAFAVFEHGTSRAGDPQLHSHAIMLNIALRADGTTGTLETQQLFQHKMAAGALYRAELAYLLERDLGLAVDRKGFGFEILGVSDALMDEFSTRRKEIEERLTMLGEEGAIASERVALQSRTNKGMVARRELEKEWKEMGLTHNWSNKKANSLIGRSTFLGLSQEEREPIEALCAANATEEVTEHQSTFAERDIVRFLAEEAQGRGLSADDVLSLAGGTLTESPKIRTLGAIRQEIRYTTEEIWTLEQDLVRRATELSEKKSPEIGQEIIREVISSRPTLKKEQQEAIEWILGEQTGKISLVTGDAGTGKTFLLAAVREAFEKAGRAVYGATLTGKAAQELQEGAGIESSTLHRLLGQWENGDLNLDPQSVLVVDEAAMVDTRKLHQIVSICGESGASLVLIGDGKQLQAIEIGGGFQNLSNLLGFTRLQEIVRQTNVDDRKMVKGVSEGKANDALKHLLSKGQLSILKNRREAKVLLMNQWAINGTESPKDHLILASRNLDVLDLNRGAQRRRLELGAVGGESLTVGESTFYENDRILFTRNRYGLGVRNGTLGTISYLDPDLRTLSVELDDGRSVTISTGDYDHVKLGYAITTHKSQGLSVPYSYVLTDEMMQDREATYVQFSRAKESTHVFTTAVEAGKKLSDLSTRMKRSHEKELAIEQAKRAKQTTELAW